MASRTIQDAEDAIKRRCAADGFHATFDYSRGKVIETDRWWYIPYCSIGCSGFIVNKDDLYVNGLGSALTLEQCFWGHEHGVVCDLVDFTFSPDTDRALAARLLSRFKHMHPNAKGTLPTEPVWYRDSDIPDALARWFPVFNRHFVWFSIPELMHAYERDSLRFTCTLSNGV